MSAEWILFMLYIVFVIKLLNKNTVEKVKMSSNLTGYNALLVSQK